ncbi:MAG: Type 1 glutamine amidotransferase-like domain-containing protein [Lachnospiraceae bacterium]|nr:Type 1 glutamine amidotransferase-like domain-containing protein [Lachnospiraceae bacterium]
MIAFLTSNPGDSCVENGVRVSRAGRLSEENGFLERLKTVWPEKAECLLLCAEPERAGMNDRMGRTLEECFALSGLSVYRMTVCDQRNSIILSSLLLLSNVVILSGGHTLTQNRFFRRIGLKQMLQQYDGLLIGISGGSMNCGKEVYALPELPGETSIPARDRFLTGLGLMEMMILPHFQLLETEILDGKRLIGDIALPDSRGHCFYGLPDGSYVQIQDGECEIVGRYCRIMNGEIFLNN